MEWDASKHRITILLQIYRQTACHFALRNYEPQHPVCSRQLLVNIYVKLTAVSMSNPKSLMTCYITRANPQSCNQGQHDFSNGWTEKFYKYLSRKLILLTKFQTARWQTDIKTLVIALFFLLNHTKNLDFHSILACRSI